MKTYFWDVYSFRDDYISSEEAEKISHRANMEIIDYIEKHPGADNDEIAAFSDKLWEMYCAGKF